MDARLILRGRRSRFRSLMSAIRQIDGGGGAPAKADPAPHALVFDSGVGGLSVLDEVRALMPGARLTYAADNFAFPYGPKPVDELVGRVTSVLRKLVEETQPDVLVIACNTASTQALDAAREMLPMPIVGVVPAVKPAAKASFSRTIGLLATAATVASPYTKSLIEAAERKLQGEPPDPAILSGALDRMLNAPGGDAIDIVVLGCTHFPLLKPELSAMAAERGRNIAWIDSGAAIARRVRTLFERAGLTPPTSSASAHRAIFTADTPAVERMRSGLAGYGLTEIGFLRV